MTLLRGCNLPAVGLADNDVLIFVLLQRAPSDGRGVICRQLLSSRRDHENGTPGCSVSLAPPRGLGPERGSFLWPEPE